jgi:hypothetical protein
MVASGLKHSNYNDYDAQGQIVQDLRLTSRTYSVPILTITQNSRLSENVMQEMNNSLIGDSYKKIRYSDTVLMIRQREDLDLLADRVKRDVINDTNTSILASPISDQYYKEIVPFEVSITKAKEGSRSPSKFHLFSRTNLRVYDQFQQLKDDLIRIEQDSKLLLQKIEVSGFIVDMTDDSPFFVESDDNPVNFDLL